MNSFRECPELREIVVWHREKKEYCLFAVSSEEDVAIWLYLRGVLSATAPHGAYMDKYDATFLEIKGEYDVYNIAVSRLRNPVDLSPERRQIYENALSGAVPQIIRQDRVDQLTAIGEAGVPQGRSAGRVYPYGQPHRRRMYRLSAGVQAQNRKKHGIRFFSLAGKTENKYG